jgi:limonene-1,2-epoxide hydrolase
MTDITVTQTSPEIEVVENFLAAMERMDTDGVLKLLDADVVYQNVPLPPARGRDAVEAQLRWFERRADGFDVVTHNIASNGPIVLTERTDAITIGPVRGAFWVCGTFEVRNGLITLWRDRFDPLDVAWSFVRGAGRAFLDRAAAR